MQKRHFEMIARVLRERRAKVTAQEAGETAATIALDVVAHDFADILADQNPGFDRARFLKACGCDAPRPMARDGRPASCFS
jgi:hypothetical protein